MTTRSASFTVLVLSQDQDLQSHLKKNLKDVTLVMAKDLGSIPKSKRPFDAVLVEAKRGALTELAQVQRAVDPAQSMVLTGPADFLRHACGFLNGIRTQNGYVGANSEKVCLEHYIESKLGEFVKGMKSTAGRDLHPMLISAVERPLITFALKETNGNQIQAAHLLGMNRNTLRKKISELRIAVKREKGRKD
ncbi:helix-turn-helix domain-containing protein [Candidatus Nitrospira bockiana]